MKREGHRVTLDDLRPAPVSWPEGLRGELIPEERIRQRIEEMAGELCREYRGEDPIILGILNGAFVFLADLVRRLPFALEVDFAGLSSYREGIRPGELRVTLESGIDMERRRVLLVDDILDGGRTLAWMREEVMDEGPEDVRICVLLEKRREGERPVRADHVGFSVPDCFVVGYGLDHGGRYRNLASIGVLEKP